MSGGAVPSRHGDDALVQTTSNDALRLKKYKNYFAPRLRKCFRRSASLFVPSVAVHHYWIFESRCIVAYLDFFSRGASLLACIHPVQFQRMRGRAYEVDAHTSNQRCPTLPTRSPTDGVKPTNETRLDTSGSPYVCKIRCTQAGANAMLVHSSTVYNELLSISDHRRASRQ